MYLYMFIYIYTSTHTCLCVADRLGDIAKHAEAANFKVKDAIVESQRKPTAVAGKGGSNDTATSAPLYSLSPSKRSIRASAVASRSQVPFDVGVHSSSGAGADGIALSSQGTSSIFAGVKGRSHGGMLGGTVAAAKARSGATSVSDELVFADFTGAFPRKGAGI